MKMVQLAGYSNEATAFRSYKEIKEFMENLKCCGNCQYRKGIAVGFIECKKGMEKVRVWQKCFLWEYDDICSAEREVV